MAGKITHKVTLAVQMTVDQAMAFYEACIELGIKTEEERAMLLASFIEHGKASRAFYTKRTKAQLIKDLAKHGPVLVVGNKDGK